MKSGVFPMCSEPLLEGAHIIFTTFTLIVAQCMNRHPWITAVTSWERILNAPVADWTKGLNKEALKILLCRVSKL